MKKKMNKIKRNKNGNIRRRKSINKKVKKIKKIKI
jgi:hypothetical protein